MAPHLEASPPTYVPHDPRQTILSQVIAEHLETFLGTLAAAPTATGLPAYVGEAFYAYLQCSILAHGFVRLGCDTCPHQRLLAFSCKTRGFCPSWAGQRLAQQAVHLVEEVLPWGPTRQGVVSVPLPRRDWMAPSRECTTTVHTIIRRPIAQYYVKQAGRNGATRAAVQSGSVTFVQRFGGSRNANLHSHLIFLEGVFVDRTAQGLTPRFVQAAPPTDTEVAEVHDTSSQRIIRHLRTRGSLEADSEDVVPTGSDPARDEDPDLARTRAASVQQRIAFGERAGQRVRRLGSGFGTAGEGPPLTGTRCASVNGFSRHANTPVPAHRRDQLERLWRYTARGAVSLERLQVNADGDLLHTFTHPWSDGTTGIKLSPMELLEKPPWCRCPVCIRCVTAAAWHHTASCGPPSSRRRVSKA